MFRKKSKFFDNRCTIALPLKNKLQSLKKIKNLLVESVVCRNVIVGLSDLIFIHHSHIFYDHPAI